MEKIMDRLNAQRRLGRKQLSDAVLYSTSRPCSLCEAAATQAAVSRMFFGSPLADGGAQVNHGDDGELFNQATRTPRSPAWMSRSF